MEHLGASFTIRSLSHRHFSYDDRWIFVKRVSTRHISRATMHSPHRCLGVLSSCIPVQVAINVATNVVNLADAKCTGRDGERSETICRSSRRVKLRLASHRGETNRSRACSLRTRRAGQRVNLLASSSCSSSSSSLFPFRVTIFLFLLFARPLPLLFFSSPPPLHSPPSSSHPLRARLLRCTRVYAYWHRAFFCSSFWFSSTTPCSPLFLFFLFPFDHPSALVRSAGGRTSLSLDVRKGKAACSEWEGVATEEKRGRWQRRRKNETRIQSGRRER